MIWGIPSSSSPTQRNGFYIPFSTATPFWRVDAQADYGELNALAKQRINLDRVTPHWDDVLRLIGSLKLSLVPAMGIMRT